jgi:hypothetical protein
MMVMETPLNLKTVRVRAQVFELQLGTGMGMTSDDISQKNDGASHDGLL